MKKLLLLFVVVFFSCRQESKYYYVEEVYDFTNNGGLKSGYKLDSFTAESNIKAYDFAAKKYLNTNFNFQYERKIQGNFDVLDINKESILNDLTTKSKDSIFRIYDRK